MNELEVRLEDIKESIDVAVIGCYVNGPGESKAAHVGLTGASLKSLIYIDGSPDHKIDNDEIINHLEKNGKTKGEGNKKRKKKSLQKHE